jgi:2-oxoglutarate dehydrogenase complex dehydrogenase (E1) component-like enzyme
LRDSSDSSNVSWVMNDERDVKYIGPSSSRHPKLDVERVHLRESPNPSHVDAFKVPNLDRR